MEATIVFICYEINDMNPIPYVNIKKGMFYMGKPSIGTAVTPAQEKEKKQIIKELTILNADSKDSIFNLVFSETKTRSLDNDEQ